MRNILLLSVLVSNCAVIAADLPVPRFKAVVVDAKVEIGYGVTVADVNGDKKPDILLADKNLIVWYENPSWTKHVMAEKLTSLDHVCIAAQDIDGDGKCEVAVGAGWNPGDTLNSGAVFYLVPPADRTQRWEPVTLPHEPTVHRMRWVKNGDGGYSLVMVPLHGRGNKPATGEGAGAKVLRYQKPANVRDAWKAETLDESMHKAHNFDPVQWDDDAAQEILVGGKEGVFLMDVKGATSAMTQLTGTESGGAGEVRAGRLSAGKKFVATVEPMHGNNLVVYTAEAGSFGMERGHELRRLRQRPGREWKCSSSPGRGWSGWCSASRASSALRIKATLASRLALRLREASSPSKASRRQWLRTSTPPQCPRINPSHCSSRCFPGSQLDR